MKKLVIFSGLVALSFCVLSFSNRLSMGLSMGEATGAERATRVSNLNPGQARSATDAHPVLLVTCHTISASPQNAGQSELHKRIFGLDVFDPVDFSEYDEHAR